MFGETTISQVKVWNHLIETTIKIWLFRVPGGTSETCKAASFYTTRNIDRSTRFFSGCNKLLFTLTNTTATQKVENFQFQNQNTHLTWTSPPMR